MLVGNNSIMTKQHKYTNDRATQIVLSLLKAHGIKRVVASPGTTNIALVGSMQIDPWFEMYSSVDERSAAYLACGMALESGEPVVLTCTGATASRNYFPGLTEAYYRKLPILAITGSHGDELVGHLHAQVIDRQIQPRDTVKMSVSIDKILDEKDEWSTIVKVNAAILELRHKGGGPVHINLRQATDSGFDTNELPLVRKIKRISISDNLPIITAKSIAIFIGAHKPFTDEETNAIDYFCEHYNASVFCDHTSGFKGKYKVQYALPACQSNVRKLLNVDLLIHLGEVSCDYYTIRKVRGNETWRVSEDGSIRDLYRNLFIVFEMREIDFFNKYNTVASETINLQLFKQASLQYQVVFERMPELPLGNIWCAMQMYNRLPINSSIHFSILNTIRSWNFFNLDNSIQTNCNVGGFGIDGPLSTVIGASIINPNKMHFIIVGDLAFFYDINSLGNRHIHENVRILLINNGIGTEFKNYDHPASKWGDSADLFMAAGGHFGRKSKDLVKCYANNLGFKYLSADSKESFLDNLSTFFSEEEDESPIIFEVFCESEDESNAINAIRHIMPDDRSFSEKAITQSKSIIKGVVKSIFK